MASFDPSTLEVAIDDCGQCWITYPGPPLTIWELIEIDGEGQDGAQWTHERLPALEPVWRLGARQWMLCLRHRSDGTALVYSLNELSVLAARAIHTLAGVVPEQVSVPG